MDKWKIVPCLCVESVNVVKMLDLPKLIFTCNKISFRICEFFSLKIFFSFIFISWKLITLQRCSCFCHTLT